VPKSRRATSLQPIDEICCPKTDLLSRDLLIYGQIDDSLPQVIT